MRRLKQEAFTTAVWRRAVAASRTPEGLGIPLHLPLLLGLALLLRLALAPLTEGWDFHAFAQLAGFVNQGHDVYAMRRSQMQLPWAYLPLCLNMFAGLGWLSTHLGVPFRLMGKLPIIIADVEIGWLLYSALLRRGHSEHLAIMGMSLYLFNPLVIYNSAVVGRFDAIALVFLLLALEYASTALFAPAFALSIAAKTFPLFLIPVLALGRDRASWRRLAWAAVLVCLFSLPFVLTDLKGVIGYLLYDTRSPWLGRLSWYSALQSFAGLSAAQTLSIARTGSLLFPLALLTLLRRPLYIKAAAGLALFIVFNRAVYEQYLLWPLPFLIVVALHYRSRLALGLILLFTVAGILENEQTWAPYDAHLRYSLVPAPWPPLNLVLAAAIVLFVGRQVWGDWRPKTALRPHSLPAETNQSAR